MVVMILEETTESDLPRHFYGRITDVVGAPGDTGLIIGDYYIAEGHKRMILMSDDKNGVWLAGVGDYVDEDWCGSRAEFDAAGWTPANDKADPQNGRRKTSTEQ